MCRPKNEEDRRCSGNTSTARKLRRHNLMARNKYSNQVIARVEPKTKPFPRESAPLTIENIQDEIQSAKRIGTKAKVIKSHSVFALQYDDQLKMIGAGIEYIAESEYNAPTDNHIREIYHEVFDRILPKVRMYEDEAMAEGKNEAQASLEAEVKFRPELVAELKPLFEKRSEAFLKALKDVGVEFAEPTSLQCSPNSDPDAENSLRLAMHYFPRSWVDASNKLHNEEIPLYVKNSKSRAHYKGLTGDVDGVIEQTYAEITVTQDSDRLVGEDSGMSIAMHEFSHRVEHSVLGIKRIEKFFLDRRAGHYPTDGSVIPEEATVIYEGMFGYTEKGYKDNLPTHYMGKLYDGDVREILSMGMESLFAGAHGGFVGIMETDADPEYKQLILGMLASTSQTNHPPKSQN